MTTFTVSSNRIDAIVARQRSSRARDLVFAAILAVGIGLWGGALRSAVASASTPVAMTTTSAAPLT